MSGIIRKIVTIVGFAALALTGIGAIAGVAAGFTAGAGITAVAGLVGVSTGILLAGAAVGLLALTSKRPSAIAGGSQTEFSADPRAGVPYAMGRTGTRGNLVLRRAADGWSDDTPNDLMDMVTVLSGGGPIHSFESFTADKAAVTFDGSGNAVGQFNDWMWQKRQLGACPESSRLTVTAGVSTAPTGWTTAHKLSGLAATIWRLRYDAKGKHYQSGIPRPLWVIKAVRCYDPRKDSTYPGGSGSHRWNDETTWEWSDNPYLHGLTWCIGRKQNGKRAMGLGATLDQIIVSQFAEGAGIAEANNWIISGVIYSRPDTKWNNLKLILQAGGGEPVPIGARIGCRINAPRVSLATITADDIIGEASLATTQPRRARINTVIPRYRSEAHEWEVVPAAPVQVAAHVTTDGDERTREIEYSLVPQVNQAAALARYDIENSRELGPGTFPLKPVWAGYKPGDCLTINVDDVANQKICILEREIDPTGARVTLTVRSETDAKHAFALGQTTTAPPTASVSTYDPSAAAPAASDWTLSASGSAGKIALRAAGTVTNRLANAVIWEVRPYVSGAGVDVNWIAAGIDAPTIVTKDITGLETATAYEVSVRYRVRGVIGSRRILGPVTTAGQFLPPGYVSQLIGSSYVIDADPLDGLLQAMPTSITVETHTRVYSDKTVSVTGATLTTEDDGTTALAAGTLYHVYYDDSTRAGGAVTFKATRASTTAANSAAAQYRHYVGSITTAATGATTATSGGGAVPGGWAYNDFR